MINNICDEGLKALGAEVRHVSQANASDSIICELYRDGDDGFLDRFSAFDAPFFAPNIALVHFYATMKSIPAWTDHCASEFVKPCPSGHIASQAENPLQPKRISAVLLAGKLPHRKEP